MAYQRTQRQMEREKLQLERAAKLAYLGNREREVERLNKDLDKRVDVLSSLLADTVAIGEWSVDFEKLKPRYQEPKVRHPRPRACDT